MLQPGTIVAGVMGLRSRASLSALSAAALAAVVMLAVDSDRLPAWSWSIGGVTAEVGPGRPSSAASENPGAARAGQGGSGQGASSGRDADRRANAGGAQSGGTRYTFATYAEAEEFAAKARAHLLAPQWVPADFAPEPLSVTLSVLPPEVVAALGRAQRLAVTQRFVSPDATITIVQSSPPSFFDLMLDPGSPQDELVLDNGLRVRFGQFPQGVILYWRERGDVRSIGIIGDQGAAARLSRDDWRRFADSLS